MNTVINNIHMFFTREENPLNIRDSYLEIEFTVTDNAAGVFC